MSRTTDLLFVPKPTQFPHIRTVLIPKSVESILFSEVRDNENLVFIIGPTWHWSPLIKRKLAFLEDETLKLDFESSKAGVMQLDGKQIFLLLEKIQ
jgi:hypothetical protein